MSQRAIATVKNVALATANEQTAYFYDDFDLRGDTPLIPSLHTTWQRHRWLRFLVTGGFNTAFSYSVFALLVFMGLNYALSNLISLMLGILFSFRTQSALVFNGAGRGIFWRYVAVWAFLYFCNIGMIGGLIRLGASAYVAGAMIILPTALASFFLQKYLVFPHKKVV